MSAKRQNVVQNCATKVVRRLHSSVRSSKTVNAALGSSLVLTKSPLQSPRFPHAI